MMNLILIRHGETQWNVGGRFRGRADVALNERGRRQADATAERIARVWKPTTIYSSPVVRAADTARHLSQKLEVSPLPDARLSDVDYGAWQGLTRDEVAVRFPTELATFESTPSRLRITNGEDFVAVRERLTSFLSGVGKQHADDTIVAVGHTEINRILILIALGLTTDALWQIDQQPCAINVLRRTERRWMVVTINDTCHLDTDRVLPKYSVTSLSSQ